MIGIKKTSQDGAITRLYLKQEVGKNIKMAIGNDKTVWSNIGASNHTDKEREKYDYYATDPSAITLLHKHGLLLKSPIYWESSCGGGI